MREKKKTKKKMFTFSLHVCTWLHLKFWSRTLKVGVFALSCLDGIECGDNEKIELRDR